MNNFFLATYLAIKEVIRNRGRFFLVALVIALITVLVLFIAALGEGLSDANRQYVANLDAQLIVFLEKSDYSITASRLETNTAKAVRRVEGVADAGPIYTSNSEIVSLPEPKSALHRAPMTSFIPWRSSGWWMNRHTSFSRPSSSLPQPGN